MNYIHFQGWRVTNKWQRSAAEQALPEFNQAALAQLEAMGFPLIRCQKALLATGNSDPEAAMEWLFAHMEDPGTFFYTHYSVQPDLSHANHRGCIRT